MLIYAVKVISIFLFAVALMRTMGKATLAQETPHDLIAIIIVGTLSAQPLATVEYGKALFGMVLVAIIPYFVFPADLASMGEQILSGRTDDSCRTWEDHRLSMPSWNRLEPSALFRSAT